ncbi:hypothetical protein G6F31_016506 [Rhizopus arrhizus]|nr:hypothetical protein G6F31_016506 [Rhizopus arrhizus]
MAARRHRLQQIHAHFKAARERIAVDARVMRQHRARLRPAEYAIHAARRHAGTVAGAQQQRAGQRGAGRRLVDHGITCQQCRAHHVHGQRQREVEGRDDREHAVGAQHVVRAFIVEGARQWLPVAVAAFGLVAVIAHQVDGFLSCAQRFQPRLADFDHRRHGEVILAFRQHHRQPAQHGDARRPPPRGPGWLGAARTGNRLVDRVRARAGKTSDQQPLCR